MMWQGSSYEPWIHTTEEKSGNRGSEGLMADSVKVTNHFWSLLIKLNNFTFDLKAVLCLENTILDSRLASLLAWIEAGAWAELGNMIISYRIMSM